MLTRRIVDRILPSKVSLNGAKRTSAPGGLGLSIGFIAGCVVAEVLVINIGIDDLDEGYFVQQGVRVLHGQVPFRDFETLYSPGLVYVHAWLFSMLGGPSLIAPRALSLVARAVTVGLLCVLTRPLVRQPLWAAAPALVLLLGFDDAPLRWEPHPGWLSSMFALLAVLCAAHRSFLLAGTAAAATYALKQNTGVFILAAIVWWSGRNHFRTPLLAFVALSLVWLLPLVIAVDGNLEILRVLIGGVNEAGLWSAPEPTILIPLACVVGGVWLRQRVNWYLLAGTALFLTELPRMDTSHLVWSAPLLLVVGAIALDRLPLKAAAVGVTATVLLLAPNWTSRLAYLAEPRSPIAGVEAPRATVDDVQGAVAEIQQRTSPGEPIFVYPTSPLLYVLADRPNPTRFDHLNPGAADTQQLVQVVADVRSNVRVVVISDFWQHAWEPHGNEALEQILNSEFTQVARHGPYRVLVADL
jgi:hypothetical protein